MTRDMAPDDNMQMRSKGKWRDNERSIDVGIAQDRLSLGANMMR